MEKLKFCTANGVCGLTCEWDFEEAEHDASGWLEVYGSRIGSSFVAPRPDAHGYIDMSQFVTVHKAD